MGATVSLADLRTRLRRLTDTESFTARFPDAEMNDYLQRSARLLYERLRVHLPEALWFSSKSVNTTAGTSYVALPTGTAGIAGIDYTHDGDTVSLERFEWAGRNDWPIDANWSTSTPKYAVIGNRIVLRPVPDAAYALTVYSVPTTSTMSTTVGFLGVNGWEEWMIHNAAALVATKDQDWEQSDRHQARAEQVYQQIIASTSAVDIARPRKIHDVYEERAARRWRWMR
jgi:hypothetical protein